jgi:hypothetical protein
VYQTSYESDVRAMTAVALLENDIGVVSFQGSTAVTVKIVVFCNIEPQFVLHRRHITSPLHNPAG